MAGTGERHPDSQMFVDILGQMLETHDRKQKDYGKDDVPFANVEGSAEWGVPNWVGAMLRATDKVRRLQSFALKGELANESAEDAFIDLANYAIIALIQYRKESS